MLEVAAPFHQADFPSYNAANIDELKRTFATGLTKSYQWRVEQLTALKSLIEENSEAITLALHTDLGKCETESWLAEIGYSTADIKGNLKRLKAWMKPAKISTPMITQPGKCYTISEPLGVALIIGAWNYPFQLVITP
ncbi:MAG: aldehyde dehydrogenase (NAD+), partial [Glaciecola sp.]